jgi:ABC-type nickel/cobalt efflux system permease component RcnA
MRTTVVRRRIAIALVTLCGALAASLAASASAGAHPLGNFTINRYAGIEVDGSAIYIRYALDVAEIPTYQLGPEIRRPGYAARFARNLVLTLDGRRVPLRVVDHRTTTRPGAGGLDTLRLDAIYRALGHGTRLSFEDTSFADRIGWREVTIVAHDGGKVVSADVPSTSSSDELRAYPSDLLRSPLSVTSAVATVSLGSSPGSPRMIGAVGAPHARGGFESLVAQGELSVGVLLLSLLIAAFWGAAHALTPGHGKAMVAAYLVGTKGTPRHAVLLGGTVTAAHTAGVFALGFVTLGLSAFIVPEQLYPWLTFVSGVLVVLVGASVLRQRLRSRPHGPDHDHHHDHGHDHHDHHHHHAHHHHHEDRLTSKGILGVGIAAGLLPCPSALVVLLSAIALHRIVLGLALIVAFSLGLAATITGIGLVAVLARRTFGRVSLDGTVVRSLPAVSAALILVVGLVITVRALPGVI